MNGPMEEGTMENGKIITCMAKGSILGKTEESMKETTSTIESMALVSIPGKMEDNILVNGKTASNTEKAPIDKQLAKKRRAIGKTEKELNGLTLEISYVQ